MSTVRQFIGDRLKAEKVEPLLGTLIPESITADLLGYSRCWYRRLASQGLAPLPFVRRGNRRFYRVDDVVRFYEESEGRVRS